MFRYAEAAGFGARSGGQPTSAAVAVAVARAHYHRPDASPRLASVLEASVPDGVLERRTTGCGAR